MFLHIYKLLTVRWWTYLTWHFTEKHYIPLMKYHIYNVRLDDYITSDNSTVRYSPLTVNYMNITNSKTYIFRQVCIRQSCTYSTSQKSGHLLVLLNMKVCQNIWLVLFIHKGLEVQFIYIYVCCFGSCVTACDATLTSFTYLFASYWTVTDVSEQLIYILLVLLFLHISALLDKIFVQF